MMDERIENLEYAVAKLQRENYGLKILIITIVLLITIFIIISAK